MDNKNKPAYPAMDMNNYLGVDRLELRYEGLTKREMFAMTAMQGLCANSVPGSHHSHNFLVTEAIEIADELLKQLEQE